MTAADRLRKEGFERGIETGIEKGIDKLRAILTKQLQLRFGEVPAEARERIAKASAADLKRWTESVIAAPDLWRCLNDLAEQGRA